MSLIEFLQETKKILNSGFQEVDTVHVVIGNEACDLDSAVSALALAYLFKLTSTGAVIPVLGIPKQKYRLRTETTYLFRNHGILDDLLTFSDQIDLHELRRQGKLRISLVDHNVLPGLYSDLDDCVVYVIDHRPQVRKPDSRVKIKIEPVGSCASLITKEILNKPDVTIDRTVYILLYGTILIDTVNLSPAAEKMTEQDVTMVDKLRELLPDVNGDDLYGNIQKAKTDTSDLTTLELLEKDLKIVSGNTVKIAMSSISMKLQDFLGRDNLENDLDIFSKCQSVNGIVVMMIHEVLPGQPARDILIYSMVTDLQQKLCDSLNNEKNPDLKLDLVSTSMNNTSVYHQGCIKASRKLVLPIIQRTIDAFTTTSNQSNNSNVNTAVLLDSYSHSNQTGTTNCSLKEGSSNETKNVDLLSGIEPLLNLNTVPVEVQTGTIIPVNEQMGTSTYLLEPKNHHMIKSIPEISINNSLNEFDEADIMFQSLDVTNSSQCSSSHTSGPPSAFTSYPVTPPNSFTDISGHYPYKDFTLPSLNSAEMLEKIMEKKGRLPSCESADDHEGNSVPYTPQNSYMEGAFEQYAKDHQLPSFNSAEMVQRIEQKRSSMEMSSLQEDVTVRRNNEEFTPFTPHNSYRDISLLSELKTKQTFLDTNKLQQTLEIIEGSKDARNKNGLHVKERTDSGLFIFDTSDMFNPTDIDNNIVAVGLAQEMTERETTVDDLLISWDDNPSDGGAGMKDSETFDAGENFSNNKMKESDSSNSNVNKTDRKYDYKTESLLLHQSIDEFAQNLTGKLIDEALNAFPEKEQEVDGAEGRNQYQNNNRGLEDLSCEETVVNYLPDKLPGETEYLSTIDSRDVPVETDYLSSVDPLHGNLNLAEDNQEIVESTSFRKISGEEPQTVRQEILLQHTQDKVEEEPCEGGVSRYAANLVQQVISGAMASVTMTTSTSDVSSEESGVTWSREESFDTVSSIPHVWSGRSSFDKNSHLTSFDSDDVMLDKNCQMFSSIETQESISSSQSNETSSDSIQCAKVKEDFEILNDTEQKRAKSGEVNVEEKVSIHSVGLLNLNKMESVDYISSENESENLSPLKLESANLLEQLPWTTSDSEPYKVRNKASLDSLEEIYKPIYQKGDTVEYISSEGEGQNPFSGMNSSQSSEPTSSTTEGSYQVMSPDQQLNDIKGEIITSTEGIFHGISPDQSTSECAVITQAWKETVVEVTNTTIISKSGKEMNLLITTGSNSESSEMEREVTNDVISESVKESNLQITRGSYYENIEIEGKITHKNMLSENEEETRGSNSELKEGRSNESEVSVLDDKGMESDTLKRKEMYMTSAGRISIASDSGDTTSVRRISIASDSGDTTVKQPIIDHLIEETFGEVGNLIAEVDNTLTQADETVMKADTILASLHSGHDTIKETRGGQDEFVETKEYNQPVKEEKGDKPLEDRQEEPDSRRPVEPDNKRPVDTDNKIPVEPANEGTNQPKGAEKVKKGMDFTDEWHEDPIPGMENRETDSSESDSDSDSDSSDKPVNRPTSLQTQRKKKIKANFNILKEDYTSPDDIDTVDNGGDLEWENDTPVSIPKDPIPEYSAEDEYQDAKHWRGVEVNGKQQKIDLRVIDPYKKVLSHGGYYGDGLNAIIVFSGSYLPDRNRKDYQYVMDNLFLYVISTLELLVAEDYMIVYFHGATPRRQMPSFGWLKKCYQLIDRRLRKNLKGLLLIHPTLWLRTIVLMTKPFISSKFSSKLRFVRTLHDLSKIVPMEYIYVPDQVQKYDSNLLQPPHSPSSSTTAPHTPP